MALGWDYEDAPRLVRELSPPASPQEAERILRRICRGFSRELWREQHESQLTSEIRDELTALRRALDGLSPRAHTVLCDALGDRLFLPFPYEQAQAVINPCRAGVPATRESPAVRLRSVRVAVDIALDGLPELPRGAPGTISSATKRAIVVLCRVYCHLHRGAAASLESPHANDR
jgi:hypothetical protein